MANKQNKITIGTVGAGYAAHLHSGGFKKVSGVEIRLKTICDVDEKRVKKTCEDLGFEGYCTDFDQMLKDDEIDVIDICTPPFNHVELAKKALAAGKNVFCEKPMTGYYGKPGDPEPIGKKVSKKQMYEAVMAELDSLVPVLEKSGKQFMYGQNLVYCPAVQRAAEVIEHKKSKILLMISEISMKGSTTPVAGQWNKMGGGILARNGVHPISMILTLKAREAAARGETITLKSVNCDWGTTTYCLGEEEKQHIKARPQDVEDNATLTITFSDGTKALVIASDTVLGGTTQSIRVCANNVNMHCHIVPSGAMQSYMLDEDGMEDVVLGEMLPTNIGWQQVLVSDEVARGFSNEFQDFCECAVTGRKPLSGIQMAYDVCKVLYAAYWSAEEGRRIDF